MLRKGLAGGAESSESSFQEAIRPTSGQPPKRFEHYELVTGQDGQPVELGRGAMGVTYKAFDVDLHCPVTLKVINEKYLGDESARLRFLREARAAASVRHTNVASVFRLGRTGDNYFYAMEFVEGETLDRLIKHSGRLDVKLALEIATQVAAGLAAVHEQHLVHRDIKPANIMMRLKEGGGVTAKIIDLGLAKTLDESASEAAISSPGTFAGTPEFASPEQFAGVGVDIRSDLYSLGVTLWVMVTGQTPFRGPSAEVLYQHQHAPLPLERLKGLPQPLVVLLEALLEKDPGRRFKNPAELLRVMPTITGQIAARRRITRQSLRKTPATASRVGTRKPSTKLGPKKISVARLPVTGSDVFGREEDIAFLDRAWATKMSTSLQSLRGPGSESPRSLTIGFEGWQLNTIAPRSSSLAGPFTDRAPVGKLRPPMNFLMLLLAGLMTQIRDSGPPGRRARDSRSSSPIVEPCLFWMVWNHSKIRLVHKKDGCVSLLSRRSCASLLPSIRGFA
jgi:serine/threonine protein kinase